MIFPYLQDKFIFVWILLQKYYHIWIIEGNFVECQLTHRYSQITFKNKKKIKRFLILDLEIANKC